MNILVVGSLGGPVVSGADVRAALDTPLTINNHRDFVGRPGTRLYVSAHHVLKIRNDFSMARGQAEEWCRRQLVREQRWQIYHPSRCWLVLERDDGCAVANITRRLPTLATVLQQGAPPLHWVLQLPPRYFRFLRQHGLRQDVSLSNYAVDGDQLWYLDDDTYPPDDHVSFAHSMALFLRSLPGLSETLAEQLGHALREQALQLGDTVPAVLWHQMEDAFLSPEREPLRHALGRALLGRSFVLQDLDLTRPVAVMSDIHANRQALDAVLQDARSLGMERWLVLGDLVGYGPDPAYCVEQVRALDALVIRGNHDHGAAQGHMGQGTRRAANWSVTWTRDQLTDDQRRWLGGLPKYWQQEGLLAVHGAPQDPTFFNAYVYSMTSDSNLDYLRAHGLELCFHGHSHLPGAWYYDKGDVSRFSKTTELQLDPHRQYLVCPGSVGQPRDGSSDASYLLWWPAQRRLQWRRVAYDKGPLRQRLEAAGLPTFVQQLFAVAE